MDVTHGIKAGDSRYFLPLLYRKFRTASMVDDVKKCNSKYEKYCYYLHFVVHQTLTATHIKSFNRPGSASAASLRHFFQLMMEKTSHLRMLPFDGFWPSGCVCPV